jgi:DNA-binding transcriptional regulator YdaS (Cro superfamily)
MMTLSSYLTENKIKQREFAVQIAVHPSIVSRLTAGQMSPSLELAFAIERETRGAVPAASWLPAPTPTEEDAA